ncbi:MAG: YgiQ family radical SAM protein [Proteobacteria bacterium]|nr:YgiQ family radical SAM protein [Pseudomonadota bacterium]NDC24669.1 YgiQ family radical SAM protein [Pseudomonadota bacterium]NDD04878.1 YgiQ family radical SAM protein [Pseudomonadota bacterium]NDG25739.1 YgiQ family radical SAM protein [Pseudomonadota bacterium]
MNQNRQKFSFLPTNSTEMKARGWEQVDVVFVTGDAYVDHPSFAMAILGRVLEREGFRVAILSQPDWKSCEAWKEFGKPRLFFAISAGNMDSMINHYTANKKVRNDDAYSPGGKIGLRPDRATLAYCQRAREAYSSVPVIAGGVEASLRRLAHYDYWSDTVKRSIVLDSKADLVVFGMGEKPIIEIARRLKKGESVKHLRDMRGVAYALGASEPRPTEFEGRAAIQLPSFDQVKTDRFQFAEATKLIHLHTNPFNAHLLIQDHDKQAVVTTPPTLPVSKEEMDGIYDLPYSRRPHPRYKEPIPAYEMIKDSVTIMRGCFGGCTFCSITAHQGRIIQSRSQQSILKEINKMTEDSQFKGTISDIGGPTANMYEMRCTRPDIEKKCRRQSCVHPTICKLLGTDHGPLVDLMKKARNQPGVKKVLVASGIRMDLAQLSEEYMNELAAHHVGGLLKVAPEHSEKEVLNLMKKPDAENFETFSTEFRKATEKAGKPKQYIVPYFIASHPGSSVESMIELALFLKRNGYKPDQVQDFIPAPFDVATCMYHTGLDPFTKKEVYVAKHLRERKVQKALLQFFKPENYFEVRKALEAAGRTDLIGQGCDALIPAVAPREALEKRRSISAKMLRGEFVHRVQTPPRANKGYRPNRPTAVRRDLTLQALV